MKRSTSITTNLRLHSLRNRLADFTRGAATADSITSLVARLRAQRISDGAIAAVFEQAGVQWDPAQNVLRTR